MALVAGSQPHHTSETQLLLASRLRSAALVLFFAFSLFFAWKMIDGTYPREGLRSPILWFHLAIDLVLAGFSFVLCTRCPTRIRRLRLVELVTFGLPAAFFITMQALAVNECCHQADPIRLAARMEAILVPWLLLIFTYAIFIPNPWTRAGWIVGLMAALPLGLILYQRQHHPLAAEVFNVSMLVELSLALVIAWMTAVSGTYTIGNLRQAAYEARQLGQYRLKRLLGAGGMGEVYLAEHQLLKRPCAIKLIRPGQAADPRALARFEREVRAAARLSHWNSIEIFDYGHADDGTFYYVMEYLPGLDLGTLVERHGPLPPERALHLLDQTCDALAEAHAVGLIHRDIKPGNLFAAQRGGVYDVAKLLDFGLVKTLGDQPASHLTQDGAITGSPLFMSPEQAVGDHEPDPRGDIYSLGAVAYFLLTGRPPFQRDKPLKVMFAHAHDAPEPPSQHCPDLPSDIEQLVLRCLAKAREERFPDVQSLQQAIRNCASWGRWTSADADRWWRSQGDPLTSPSLAAAHA